MGITGASSAYAFGERALWSEVDLDLAGEVLALELRVLAHVAAHDAPHLVALQEHAQAPVLHTRRVRYYRESLHARVAHPLDQLLRHSAQAKP